MTNLFTAYGAARVLERDRQTIERAMRDLKPDGQKGNSPLWRLSRIVERLNGTHNDSASTSAPMHLAVLYAKLDQLYDRVTDAQSVAEARRIMRSEFFPTLSQTTEAMLEAYSGNDNSHICKRSRLLQNNLAQCASSSWIKAGPHRKDSN
jgi:hypothetical protein